MTPCSQERSPRNGSSQNYGLYKQIVGSSAVRDVIMVEGVFQMGEKGTHPTITQPTGEGSESRKEGRRKSCHSRALLYPDPPRDGQSGGTTTRGVGCRRQERGARKSLVDRQSESLGWSAEAPRPAPAERVRRLSDPSSHRPLRRDSSLRVGGGGSPRRSTSSDAAAEMPRSSSSGGGGFFGSFDDSRYWDFAFRLTQRQDIGNQCRECKRPFLVLNEEIAVRRGGRIELRYHKACFSMVADPRSQPASSANIGKFVRSLEGTVAPNDLYRKMRTRGHW